MIFMNFRMDSDSEIRNISKDVEQKWGAQGGVSPCLGYARGMLARDLGGSLYYL